VAVADVGASTKARDVEDTGAVAVVAHEVAVMGSVVAEAVVVESSGAPEVGSAALLVASLLKDIALALFSRHLGYLGEHEVLTISSGLVIYLPGFSLLEHLSGKEKTASKRLDSLFHLLHSIGARGSFGMGHCTIP
jgi:hypothetical protein